MRSIEFICLADWGGAGGVGWSVLAIRTYVGGVWVGVGSGD